MGLDSGCSPVDKWCVSSRYSASIDVLVVLVNVNDACSSVSSVRGATDWSSIV